MRAATDAFRHLLDCGCRRLGFIGTRAFDSGAIYPKFHAFTNVLHEAGLNVCARYVRHAGLVPGRAHAAAWQIIQADDLPEAFFVDTDYKAMEVIGARRARRRGFPCTRRPGYPRSARCNCPGLCRPGWSRAAARGPGSPSRSVMQQRPITSGGRT